MREARSNTGPARGGAGRGRGRGGGRGFGVGQSRDFGNGNANGFSGGYDAAAAGGGEGGDGNKEDRGPRQPFRGARRGGYRNGEAGEFSDRPPRRTYERHSGTAHGYEMKREGAGRGNWGTFTDETIAQLISIPLCRKFDIFIY